MLLQAFEPARTQAICKRFILPLQRFDMLSITVKSNRPTPGLTKCEVKSLDTRIEEFDLKYAVFYLTLLIRPVSDVGRLAVQVSLLRKGREQKISCVMQPVALLPVLHGPAPQRHVERSA